MTSTGLPDLETVVIRDRSAGDTEITGHRIAFVTSKYGGPGQGGRGAKDRWGTQAIWKLASGSYVIVREGFSLLYHAEPTSCRTTNQMVPGDLATLKDLAEASAEHDEMCRPCPDCEPPPVTDLLIDERVRYEWPRSHIDVCKDSRAVVRELKYSRKYSGAVAGVVSEPTRSLLNQAARNDPDWEQAPVVRLA